MTWCLTTTPPKSLASWLPFRDSFPHVPSSKGHHRSCSVQPAGGPQAAGGEKTPLLYVEEGARERPRILLMDPGQLLHDLYQVVYGGLPLHTTAIINLQGEKKASEHGDISRCQRTLPDHRLVGRYAFRIC